MWKALKCCERALARVSNLQKGNRTFLSEAYRCTDAWNKRLDSSLLSKVDVNEMYVQLDQKFQSSGKASAVDIDIYANVIKDADHVDELLDMLHKLRLTPETSNTLESTHHAVIRYLLDNGEIENLLTMLHDRINYGIFPDHLCYNILMDTFIKKGDFASAARTAVLLMLQEDSQNVISNFLALYSCHKYLEKPDGWSAPEPEPPEDPKGEEVKVRVRFIRNPYFDDHFDLQDPYDLVGKTLVFYGKSMNDVLGRTCHLRGLVLWKKYQEAAQLIKKWIENGQKECIYKEAVTLIQEHISGIPEDKITEEIQELKKLVEAFDKNNMKEGSILEDIQNRVHLAVKAQSEMDISKAFETYETWEKTRIAVLEAQLADLDRKDRLEKVDEMKKDLATRERLLTYFENRQKIDLQIIEKLAMEKELYGKDERTAEDINENYVPPEVGNRRR